MGTIDPAQLPPKRVAALRKWLHVANARLLSVQREREQLIAAAAAILKAVGPAAKASRSKRPKLASKLAKAG
jgi:hypothetical protein